MPRGVQYPALCKKFSNRLRLEYVSSNIAHVTGSFFRKPLYKPTTFSNSNTEGRCASMYAIAYRIVLPQAPVPSNTSRAEDRLTWPRIVEKSMQEEPKLRKSQCGHGTRSPCRKQYPVGSHNCAASPNKNRKPGWFCLI